MKYARGKNAVGICARSGRKMRLNDMVKDGETGQLVDPSWRDIYHPAKKPVRTEEGIALRRPAPDVDDDSPGDSGVSLAEALFSGQPYFGGET